MDELRVGCVKNNPWIICDRAKRTCSDVTSINVRNRSSKPYNFTSNKIYNQGGGDRPKSHDDDLYSYANYLNFVPGPGNNVNKKTNISRHCDGFLGLSKFNGDLRYGPGFVQKLRDRYLQLLINLSQSNLRINDARIVSSSCNNSNFNILSSNLNDHDDDRNNNNDDFENESDHVNGDNKRKKLSDKVYTRRSASCDELTIKLNHKFAEINFSDKIFNTDLPKKGEIQENVETSENLLVVSDGQECKKPSFPITVLKERFENTNAMSTDNNSDINDPAVASIDDGKGQKRPKSVAPPPPVVAPPSPMLPMQKIDRQNSTNENEVPEFVKVAKNLKPISSQELSTNFKSTELQKADVLKESGRKIVTNNENISNENVTVDSNKPYLNTESHDPKNTTTDKEVDKQQSNDAGPSSSDTDNELGQLLKRFNQRRIQRDLSPQNCSFSAPTQTFPARSSAFSPPPDQEKLDLLNTVLEKEGGFNSNSLQNEYENGKQRRPTIRNSLSNKHRSKRRPEPEGSQSENEVLFIEETSHNGARSELLVESAIKKTEFFTVASYNSPPENKDFPDCGNNNRIVGSILMKKSSLRLLNESDEDKENDKLFLQKFEFIGENVKLEKSSLFSGYRKAQVTLSFEQDYPNAYAYIDENEADNWLPGVQLDFIGYKELCLRLKREKISSMRENIDDLTLGNLRHFQPSQLKNLHNSQEIDSIFKGQNFTSSPKCGDSIVLNAENKSNSAEKWSNETQNDLLF